MGRRDLSAERREQILDAFERCIAEHGLEASTLDLVADEAGVKRTLIRHYLGNRDEVLHALVGRAIERERERDSSAATWSGAGRREIVDAVLDELFGPPTGEDAYLSALLKGMWARSSNDEATRGQLGRLYTQYLESVEIALGHAYPKAGKDKVAGCAHALLSLADGYSSLAMIGLDASSGRAVRKAALALVEMLG